tara:strand:- start:1270 stop:2328 length:1059 start_codon:yes stop_codon:yes gene_type:complete
MQDTYVAEELARVLKCVPHTCNEHCDIAVMPAYIYALDGVEHLHFPFQPKPAWMTPATLVRRVDNLFVCKATRTVHRCHAECTAPKITNSEHCLVCPISGLQWDNSTEEIKSWKLVAKCAPTLSVDKRDPNMFFRNQDGTLTNTSASLNVHVHQQTREVTALLDELMFSHTRVRIELGKYVEGVRNANKDLNKYKRFCTKQRRPKNLSTMAVIYLHAKFRRPNFLRVMDRCKAKRDALFARVAVSVVRMHEQLTACQKIVAPFRTFACACIYLMKYGLCHGVWVIPKEPAFASMLPEANVLDMFGVEKPLFTQTKNQILNAVRTLLSERDAAEVRRMFTASPSPAPASASGT